MEIIKTWKTRSRCRDPDDGMTGNCFVNDFYLHIAQCMNNLRLSNLIYILLIEISVKIC